MKLPTLEEAKQALIERRGTPLDKFVAYWEPRDGELFREMLAELMKWARSSCSMTPSEIEEAIKHLPRYQSKDPYEGFQEVDNPLRFFWNPKTEKYEEKQ